MAGQGREHSAEVWGKIDGFWSLMTHKTSALWNVWLEETDTAWISPEQSTPGAWRNPRCHSLETFKKVPLWPRWHIPPGRASPLERRCSHPCKDNTHGVRRAGNQWRTRPGSSVRPPGHRWGRRGSRDVSPEHRHPQGLHSACPGMGTQGKLPG